MSKIVIVNGKEIPIEEGQSLSQAFTQYLINSTDHSHYSLQDYEDDMNAITTLSNRLNK